MASDRISCCITGCRRTFKRRVGDDDSLRIMCIRHWRMGDQKMRDRHKQLRKRERWFRRRWERRCKAIEGDADLKLKFHDAWYRTGMACNRLWHRIAEDIQIKAAFGAEDAPRRNRRNGV